MRAPPPPPNVHSAPPSQPASLAASQPASPGLLRECAAACARAGCARGKARMEKNGRYSPRHITAQGFVRSAARRFVSGCVTRDVDGALRCAAAVLRGKDSAGARRALLACVREPRVVGSFEFSRRKQQNKKSNVRCACSRAEVCVVGMWCRRRRNARRGRGRSAGESVERFGDGGMDALKSRDAVGSWGEIAVPNYQQWKPEEDIKRATPPIPTRTSAEHSSHSRRFHRLLPSRCSPACLLRSTQARRLS